MVVQGITFCDWCAGVVFTDDLTMVHIRDANGCSHAFQYHNTIAQPCLKQKLEQLRQQFAAQS